MVSQHSQKGVEMEETLPETKEEIPAGSLLGQALAQAHEAARVLEATKGDLARWEREQARLALQSGALAHDAPTEQVLAVVVAERRAPLIEGHLEALRQRLNQEERAATWRRSSFDSDWGTYLQRLKFSREPSLSEERREQYRRAALEMVQAAPVGEGAGPVVQNLHK
jgi:hypothetical protein